MQYVADFSDERLKQYCIYCGTLLANQKISKEHVPSKVFLDQPYPENLFIVHTCQPCNHSFSKDEEYTAAILGVLISGSADPEKQVWSKARKILLRKTKLQQEIVRNCKLDAKGHFFGLKFNEKRLEKVLIKNARALALYMISEPVFDAPSHIIWRCLPHLSNEERQQFEFLPEQDLFPEVGSRMFIDQVENRGTFDKWTEMQDGTFRFAVMWDGSIIIRMVFREFLFAQVGWEERL